MVVVSGRELVLSLALSVGKADPGWPCFYLPAAGGRQGQSSHFGSLVGAVEDGVGVGRVELGCIIVVVGIDAFRNS